AERKDEHVQSNAWSDSRDWCAPIRLRHAAGADDGEIHQLDVVAQSHQRAKRWDYALYSTWDTTPITSVSLVKGDKLGFDKTSDGGVVAVAGSNTYPIKPNWSKGTYYWNYRKS